MKRPAAYALSSILAMVLALTLSACSGGKQDSADQPAPNGGQGAKQDALAGDDTPAIAEPADPQFSPDWRGAELAGEWRNGDGDVIYYFEDAYTIEFTVTGDGVGRVYDDYGEWGDWEIDEDGALWIYGEEYTDLYGSVKLTYRVDGETLTLTDKDGDSRSFTR